MIRKAENVLRRRRDKTLESVRKSDLTRFSFPSLASNGSLVSVAVVTRAPTSSVCAVKLPGHLSSSRHHVELMHIRLRRAADLRSNEHGHRRAKRTRFEILLLAANDSFLFLPPVCRFHTQISWTQLIVYYIRCRKKNPLFFQ